MELTEATKQSEGSQLSADAVSYVPKEVHGPLDGCTTLATTLTTSTLPSSQQPLPNYLTSCYPFVTGDPGYRPRQQSLVTRANVGQNFVRPPAPVVGPQQQFAVGQQLYNGGLPFAGNEPAIRPVAFNGPQPVGYVPLVNLQAPPPAVIPLSAFGPNCPNPPAYLPASAVGYSNPNVASSPYAQFSPSGPIPATVQWIDASLPNGPLYLSGSPGFGFAATSTAVQPTARTKPPGTAADKKVKSGTSSWRTGAHTIMCRDNSVQTDFNDEIARSTLAERPNSLFLGNSKLSEDADSDSGYSSPQHCQTSTAEIHPKPSVGSTAAVPATVPVTPHMIPPVSVPAPLPPGNAMHVSVPLPQAPMMAFHPEASMPGLMFTPFGPMSLRHPPAISQFPPPQNRLRFQNQNRAPNRVPSYPAMRVGGPGGMPYMPYQRLQNGFPVYPRQSAPPPVSYANQAPHEDANVAKMTAVGEPALPFNDVDEFPILLSAAGGLVASHGASCRFPGPSMSGMSIRPYSAESRGVNYAGGSVKQRRTNSALETSARNSSVDPIDAYKNIPGLSLTESELKAARKKMKRQELMNRAAEKELAEISLEQQVLRELRAKHTSKLAPPPDIVKTGQVPPASTANKSQNPAAAMQAAVGDVAERQQTPTGGSTTAVQQSVALNLASVAEKLESSQSGSSTCENDVKCGHGFTKPHGALSVTTPPEKKEKGKRPSTLKKVIMKEREEKKRHKLIDDDFVDVGALPSTVVVNGDDALPSVEQVGQNASPPSGDISPVSQMSPVNMSPMSVSPIGSAGVSPIAGESILGPGGPGMISVLGKIHSRRFREYCNQVLDNEIDDCCTELLQALVHFQEQSYSKEPTKVNRRLVMGLREVKKHLKQQQLKCVIIPPNVERIQSKGGLDDALNNIIELCQKGDLPFVFALGRRALGRVCAKLVPVSCVGIITYDGAEELFGRLCQLTERARRTYAEMVAGFEQEMGAALASACNAHVEKESAGGSSPAATSAVAASRGPLTGNIGGFEKLFPHLGHSRTPSACSAISIISSVQSEPTSQNYPASDPETDGTVGAKETAGGGRKVTDLDTVGESREEIPDTVSETEKLNSVGYIDTGHEADTEDDSASVDDPVRRSASRPDSASGRAKSIQSEHGRSLVKVPSGDPVAADAVPAGAGGEQQLVRQSTGRTPTIDSKKRIESWVEESQRAIEHMRVSSDGDGDSPEEDAITAGKEDDPSEKIVNLENADDDDDDLEAPADLDLNAVDDVVASNHVGRNDVCVDEDCQKKNVADDDEDDEDGTSMKTVENGDTSDSSASDDYVEALDNEASCTQVDQH